ncbi:hypothetical protein A3732_11480 [Oleiphilus sp. HI0050]|nr:hypothetical protein A3732_11480 [Oleiphilus sp. HI0050]
MKLVKLFLSAVLLVCLSANLVAETKNERIGRDQAIALVQERFEGKVLKVQLKETPRGSVYRVKFLTKAGRVRVLHVDSLSGEQLSGAK